MYLSISIHLHIPLNLRLNNLKIIQASILQTIQAHLTLKTQPNTQINLPQSNISSLESLIFMRFKDN